MSPSAVTDTIICFIACDIQHRTTMTHMDADPSFTLTSVTPNKNCCTGFKIVLSLCHGHFFFLAVSAVNEQILIKEIACFNKKVEHCDPKANN